jgi:fumarylacetoacetate (FAA) hydrolase
VRWNGEQVGDVSGAEMHFSFFQLLEHVARTRGFTAGTLLGSGTLSNEDRARGWTCIAEQRALEMIDHGEARTRFMQAGDTVELEMRDAAGWNVFGTIAQRVVPA